MENVVSLRGADIASERRIAFVETVAQSFDRYVREYGFEPEAMVFTLAGITQPSQIGWDVKGASEAGLSSVLALAAIHAAAEAQSTRQGIKE